MKIQNSLRKPVWIVFLRQLEFRRFLGVASSLSSLRVMMKEIKKDFPNEKIEVVKIGGRK